MVPMVDTHINKNLEENREKSKCYNTETNIWVFKNVFRYLSKTK